MVFSYGASTLQSFVPDTYKPTRPCYATIWGDYSGKAGQDMLDDMIDALSYLTDVDEATRVSYRDNNYCVAGYAYGMVLVQALRRYNEHEGEYGLNWDDFSKIMELDDFSFGSVSFNYKDGTRTITLDDVKEAVKNNTGSDLDCLGAPKKENPDLPVKEVGVLSSYYSCPSVG